MPRASNDKRHNHSERCENSARRHKRRAEPARLFGGGAATTCATANAAGARGHRCTRGHGTRRTRTAQLGKLAPQQNVADVQRRATCVNC